MGNTKAMAYKELPVKNNIKDAVKAEAKKIIEDQTTLSLIWVIIKRHKVGILAIGNIVLVLNWVFPAWFDVLRSLI